VFISDEEPNRVITLDHRPGLRLIEMWVTDDVPVIPVSKGDPIIEMSSFVPEPGGTRFRLVEFPPDQGVQGFQDAGINKVATRQEYIKKAPGLGEAFDPDDPRMHTTDTVDYGIVVVGEIWLELDNDAIVHLRQGDCIVQNGTRHAWRNRSSEPCLMAFVMVGANRS
jgi:hypothetical protein